MLEDGAIIPADIRLIQENRLTVQEASLTGESIPVEKDSETILPDLATISHHPNEVMWVCKILA